MMITDYCASADNLNQKPVKMYLGTMEIYM